MYLYLKYFSKYLYLNTLVGKVFVFLRDKGICIEIHFHVCDPMSAGDII